MESLSHTSQGRVLIIAGSDPSGGAGIQADIKAVTMMGAYASAAITAITIQNTLGVKDIFPIPAEVVADQIDAVLEDIGADTIKTGMLMTEEIVEIIAIRLLHWKIKLILDPVLVSTSGKRLLEEKAIITLKEKLLPLSYLATPNIPEAMLLTGMDNISTPEAMVEAGKKILKLGAEAVLVKGGHLPEEEDVIYDMLVTANTVKQFTGKRVRSNHTHGTGCTLASAIAAQIAKDVPLVQAIENSRNYIQHAIETAPQLGKGKGPLNHICKIA